MLISYSHQFIFIHVYKTAGTSVINELDRYAYHRDYPRLSDVWAALTTRRLLLRDGIPKHISARNLRAEMATKVFDAFFKFAFVRNPWDWQVSHYHFILEHTDHGMHERVRALGSFDAYIRWQEKHPETQSSLLYDASGARLVDFIGRVENIDADFAHICRRIGIQARLGHENQSQHAPYRQHYTDETRAIAQRIYAEDIERFGYSF